MFFCGLACLASRHSVNAYELLLFSVMASENESRKHQAESLTEKDIDGAALHGREPRQLTVQQLKFWLHCRGIKTTKLKTKAELIAR